jgi:hypothetical protein
MASRVYVADAAALGGKIMQGRIEWLMMIQDG